MFDPKMMIGLLFNAHQQMTASNPIILHPIKNLEKLNENKEKLKPILTELMTRENFIIFADKCLTELDKLNLPYGTAHYGYQFWVSVALTSIVKEENTIPNGCCAVKECSINLLYDIVCDVLLSKLNT